MKNIRRSIFAESGRLAYDMQQDCCKDRNLARFMFIEAHSYPIILASSLKWLALLKFRCMSLHASERAGPSRPCH